MRGLQLSPRADAASCSRMMSPLSDLRSTSLRSAQPSDSASVTAAPQAPSHGQLTAGAGSVAQQGLRSPRMIRQDRSVLAPPVFMFQRITTPLKRRAEEFDDGCVWEAGVSKRIRSLTYPSLCSKTKKGHCDSGRRMRSGSLCFPPPLPVSRSNVFMPSNMHNVNKVSTATVPPQVKVKRTLLRPALLVAPQSWGSCVLPPLSKVNLAMADNRTKTLADSPSSASALDQWPVPKANGVLAKAKMANSESLHFVFGENMSERVLSPVKTPGSEEMTESDCSSSESDSSSSESTCKLNVRNTLWESAAAYTASCRRRCLPKQVQIVTGEEKESNVVQLTCKLFVLEKGTQSWSERGGGLLRLNDLATGTKAILQSRIVMRHQGSLKVILNTKLWPHTNVHRPNRRSLQITASDLESHAIRVFLIQAGARDISRLYVAIHHRQVALRCSAVDQATETSGLRDSEGHCSSEEEEEEGHRQQPAIRLRSS